MADDRDRSILLLYWGRRGGGARMTFEFARAFARMPDVSEQVSISDRNELRDEIVAIEVPVDEVSLPTSVRRLPVELPRLVRAWWRLARGVRRQSPKWVFVVMGSPWSDAFSRPLAWLIHRGGGRLVRFVHDAVAHPGDPNRMPAWMTMSAMRAADAYVVLSEHVQEQLEAQGVVTDRIVRIELGPFSLGAPRADVGDSHDPFRLLFFGRLAEYKGLDLLVDAARTVADRGVAIDVRIVGDGPFDPGPIPGNVTIDRRWVPESELRDVLVWADAVVLPYVEASQSGVAPMAVALGLPLVVTPVGGLVEQVDAGRTGVVAERVDAEALAAAIVDLVEDPVGYREMATACVRVGGDAAWDQIAERLIVECERRR